MKKQYINPEMEIVKIHATHQLLAGSDPVLGEEYNSSTDGDPLGHDFDFEDDGF